MDNKLTPSSTLTISYTRRFCTFLQSTHDVTHISQLQYITHHTQQLQYITQHTQRLHTYSWVAAWFRHTYNWVAAWFRSNSPSGESSINSMNFFVSATSDPDRLLCELDGSWLRDKSFGEPPCARPCARPCACPCACAVSHRRLQHTVPSMQRASDTASGAPYQVLVCFPSVRHSRRLLHLHPRLHLHSRLHLQPWLLRTPGSIRIVQVRSATVS